MTNKELQKPKQLKISKWILRQDLGDFSSYPEKVAAHNLFNFVKKINNNLNIFNLCHCDVKTYYTKLKSKLT